MVECRSANIDVPGALVGKSMRNCLDINSDGTFFRVSPGLIIEMQVDNIIAIDTCLEAPDQVADTHLLISIRVLVRSGSCQEKTR